MTSVSFLGYYKAMKQVFKILLILVALLLISAPVTLADEYLWPLKIQPRISSRFGDFRAGHWHAGLDITTRGTVGYKVYAVADGYLYRIKASFWGYGRALYLKLDDGRYAVYGHLERFNNDVEDYLRNFQLKNRQYYQDIFFEPHQFPVKKGDYIALSGQSGAGAPHLHFEIRDKDNYPVNPLIQIYSLPDSHAPVVDYLVVKRFSKVGLANYHDQEFLKLKGQSPDYSVTDTVALYGQMALAVSAYDPDGSFYYGLYGADISLDGREIYSFRNDRLDYSSGGEINYVRDIELKAEVEKRAGVKEDNDRNIFYKLYIQPDDRQMIYGDYNHPAGVIDADNLDAGVHDLHISLYDEKGNRCRIRLVLKKTATDRHYVDQAELKGGSLILHLAGLVDIQKAQVQKRVSTHLPYSDTPCSFDANDNTITVSAVDNKHDYRIRFVNNNGECSPWVEFDPMVKQESVIPYADFLEVVLNADSLMAVKSKMLSDFDTFALPNNFVKALIPVFTANGYFDIGLDEVHSDWGYYVFNSGGNTYSPDSSVMISLSSEQLYDKTILKITRPGKNAQGNFNFEITPQGLLLKKAATINIRAQQLGVSPDKFSLYYYSPGNDRWYFIGNRAKSSIEGETSGGGKFGILKDIKPPAITGVKPKNGSHITDKTPNLSCVITDNLSGLKEETQLEMTIDGIWVPAYYDIDSKEFSYKVRNKLTRGSHQLSITAIDNQGNQAVVTSTFTIN